ncbi:hypothetical protein WR25_06821 [Diploscapter pachys]|uniref:Reverse transcriptase domain-containing protein n=1 Tax=Diploscapter pachys TaxID=2018661 RepID=A0A2A2LMZ8_9BILA|nr:hypothetical protein WR25_06821 [Diploscapter pachys]
MLYTDRRSVAGTTRPFEVTVGVHQGSAISPLLFSLCLDRITRDIQGEHPWTLLYADYIVLARSTRDELKKDLKKLKERRTARTENEHQQDRVPRTRTKDTRRYRTRRHETPQSQ